MAFDSPLRDPEEMKILSTINKGSTTIFVIEIVLKIIGYGFFWNGKKSYLKNIANVFDFIVVLSSCFSIGFEGS